jgi:hypothetical protein
MQRDPIDGGAYGVGSGSVVPNPSKVRGLGLCDVLRVELEPCQIAGAIEELEEWRGPLSETFEQARTRWDEVADKESPGELGRRDEEELSRSAYALHVLSRLRAQLPTIDHDERVVVVGPASMVSHFIAGAARSAVDDLADSVRSRLQAGGEKEAKLRAALAAVNAWLDTYMECEALEWYLFDPPYAPAGPII